MRTTVEIRDDLRARLLALAAARGEKGYSRIIEEALDAYLGNASREERLRAAAAVAGSLTAQEAEAMRERIRRLRERWR